MKQQNQSKEFSSLLQLPGLDHLRATAIILVFFYHYSRLFPHPEWTLDVSSFGWTGVDLFFVLSGFLIASQLFATINKGRTISFKEFYLKRFFRIIPLYLLVVTIYFLFPALREREGLAPLWKYLSFTQNFGLDLRYSGTFSHAWSLCIEEQFYLALPFILLALVYFKAIKKGMIVLLVLFIAGFAARLFVWHTKLAPLTGDDLFAVEWMKWMYYPTYARLDGLLTGVALAALYQFAPKLKEQVLKYGNLFLLLSFFVLTAAWFVCKDQMSFTASIFGFPLVAAGYGLMVIAAINNNGILHRYRSNIASKIAAYSYSIYLTHKIVIHVAQEQLSKFNISKESHLMLLLCIIASLLVAYMLNRLVEKPAKHLRDRLLLRSAAAK